MQTIHSRVANGHELLPSGWIEAASYRFVYGHEKQFVVGIEAPA
jgi:hypothetical protein